MSSLRQGSSAADVEGGFAGYPGGSGELGSSGSVGSGGGSGDLASGSTSRLSLASGSLRVPSLRSGAGGGSAHGSVDDGGWLHGHPGAALETLAEANSGELSDKSSIASTPTAAAGRAWSMEQRRGSTDQRRGSADGRPAIEPVRLAPAHGEG